MHMKLSCCRWQLTALLIFPIINYGECIDANITSAHVAVTGNIGGVIEIQTAITKDCQY